MVSRKKCSLTQIWKNQTRIYEKSEGYLEYKYKRLQTYNIKITGQITLRCGISLKFYGLKLEGYIFIVEITLIDKVEKCPKAANIASTPEMVIFENEGSSS